MKNARTPLIGLVALGAALAMPLAFAQSEPTTSQSEPTASEYGSTQDSSMQDAATQTPPADSTTAAPAQMTWADVDTDKNGSISKEESAQLASLAQVFDDADADSDGELTADEYKAFVASNSAPTDSAPTDDSEG